jgi:hypothetical protein
MSLRQLLEITHLLHARLVPQWTLRIGQNKIVRNNVGWVIHWLPLELILCIESVTVHSVCLSIYATESVPGALQGNDALIHQIVFWSVLMDSNHCCHFLFGAWSTWLWYRLSCEAPRSVANLETLGSWIIIHQGGNLCHNQFIIWRQLRSLWLCFGEQIVKLYEQVYLMILFFFSSGNGLVEDPGVTGS